MKIIDEIDGSEAVSKLHEALDSSGITFHKTPEMLAAFKSGHVITVDDDGTLMTVFNGVRQKLSLALGSWGRTADGEVHVDKRSLPKDEKHVGGIRAKSDLPDTKSRAEYITRFGGAAYEALPTQYTAPEEVRTQAQYHKLTLSQKTALSKQGVTVASFPVGDGPDGTGMTEVAKGVKVNVAALAKDKATRPNQK